MFHSTSPRVTVVASWLMVAIGLLVDPLRATAQSDLPDAEDRYQKSRYDESDPYDGWLFNQSRGVRDPRIAEEEAKRRRAREAWERGEWLPDDDTPPMDRTSAPTVEVDGPLPGESVDHAQSAPPPPKPDEPELVPENNKGLDPDDISIDGIYKNMKKAVGLGPNKRIAQEAFGKGERLFREKKFTEAIEPLKTAADRWPDSALQEDALFLLGECYFFTDQYSAAHDTYGQLLADYTNSRYLDTIVQRQFAIGRYWEEHYEKHRTWPIQPNLTDETRPRFDTFGHALEAYQRVRLYDPTGPLADDSVMAVANAYFKSGQFEHAAWNYDVLRREYPDSKHQAEAHLLGLEAKKRVYQGARYDDEPLEDAEVIADQALTQFRGELGKERERLQRSRKQVTEQKAMRDFAMGQYYETKKCYGAARYYYQNLIDKFPRTQTADRARQRMAAIKDYPDEPKNHFKWLTDMFPEH